MKKLLLISSLGAGVCLAAIVYAAASTNIVAHIQVTLPPELLAQQAPTSWWDRLRALIGVRRALTVRPDVGTTLVVNGSAYASSPLQTDATPCTTAAGTRVRPGVVASNFLPLGTLLEINKRTYIVEDRMNPRYSGYYLDIWTTSTKEALEFGRKKLVVTIVGYGTPGQNLVQTKDKEKDNSVTVVPTPQPGLWDQIKGGLSSVGETLANLLPTRVSGNANRYDVNCFEESVD
jgi:3D (Asp-Asp-Asp) domain-containing protein